MTGKFKDSGLHHLQAKHDLLKTEDQLVLSKIRQPSPMLHIFANPIEYKLTCEMLINQNTKIDGDFIGHRCSRPVKWELPLNGYAQSLLLCDFCRTAMENSDTFMGIQFPQWMMDLLGVPEIL